MADRVGCELIERQRRSQTELANLSRIDQAPYPFCYIAYLDSGRDEAMLARQLGATALFSGGGGDNLFYIGASIPEAADYAYAKGIDRSLLLRSLESSLMLNCSIWKTLWRVSRFGIFKRPPALMEAREQQYALLKAPRSRSLQDDLAYFHPLIVSASAVPPAKLEHASAISWETAPRYDPFETPTDPLETIPLISQPLIELSLAIPTYVLTLNGRDRSLARRAFADDLPPRILRRKSKGGQEEHVKSVLINNRAVVHGMLADGELVRAGYVDRNALLDALE
jgi:asparagine synthase (glutamine-hydrolysing)